MQLTDPVVRAAVGSRDDHLNSPLASFEKFDQEGKAGSPELTFSTYSLADTPSAGCSHTSPSTPSSAFCRLSIPAITASISFSSFRYGTSDTTVLRFLEIVMRPRDTAPRPRYWLMVMAFVLLTSREASTRAVHCSWRVMPSAPSISSKKTGPMLGAACARMPERESA